MSDQTAGLTYKGRPLMRKDNMIYYGSMADSHIVMLQVLDSKPVNGLNVATRVSVQLLSNDPNLRSRERIVKKSEKEGLYTALDVGCVGNSLLFFRFWQPMIQLTADAIGKVVQGIHKLWRKSL